MTFEDGGYGVEDAVANYHVFALPLQSVNRDAIMRDLKCDAYSLSSPWGSSIGIEFFLSPCRRLLKYQRVVY